MLCNFPFKQGKERFFGRNMVIVKVFVAVAVLFLSACSKPAPEKGAPTKDALADMFIQAVNQKDRKAWERLIYPASLERLKKINRGYLEMRYKDDASNEIPDDAQILFKEIPEEKPLMFENMFTYPIRPTHWMQIVYKKSKTSFVTARLQIVQEGDRWYVVEPVPTEETMRRLKNKT